MSDYPTISRNTYPKARKKHKCCECGGFIKKGEIYERSEGLFDSEFYNYVTCKDCSELRDDLNLDQYLDLCDSCFDYGEPYITKFNENRRRRKTEN